MTKDETERLVHAASTPEGVYLLGNIQAKYDLAMRELMFEKDSHGVLRAQGRVQAFHSIFDDIMKARQALVTMQKRTNSPDQVNQYE